MARSGAQTRQRIVDAAYGLFWRQGFVRASLDDIAEAASSTKRTLYQHFRSKDNLMAAVLEYSSGLAMERLQRIAQRTPDGPEAMIDSLFAQLSEWAATPRWQGTGFTRVVAELADLPGHPARVIARQHKAMVESWLAGLLAKEHVTLPLHRARELALLMDDDARKKQFRALLCGVSAARRRAARIIARWGWQPTGDEREYRRLHMRPISRRSLLRIA